MTKYLDYAGLGHLTDKIKSEIEAKAAGAPIAGLIAPYAGTSAPPGYLMCDGAAYASADYPELYAAIGVTYGGTAGTSFNVPNLSGRVPLGADGTYAIGTTGGEAAHTLTIGEMPSHTHNLRGYHAVNQTEPVPAKALSAYRYEDELLGNYTDPTGGGAAHNNMQPYLATNYIISTGKAATGTDPTSAALLQAVNELQQDVDQLSPATGSFVQSGQYASWGWSVRRSGGIVGVTGTIGNTGKSGVALSLLIGTVPVGFRPAVPIKAPCVCVNADWTLVALGAIAIYEDGTTYLNYNMQGIPVESYVNVTFPVA